MDQLPQSFREPYEESALVSPSPKARKAEMYRDSLEQGRRAGATSISHRMR